MAEVKQVDFNRIPRQKFSAADMKKVSSIMHNVKMGNMEQATTEFDAFTRDKKMDKVRSVGLRALTAGTLVLGAIVAPHVCPKWFQKMGDALATGTKNFVKNHEKLYKAIEKKFPKLTQELKGKVGDKFVTNALNNTNLLKRVANKVALGNTEVGKDIVEGLSKRNIKNLGDFVGIAAAAVGSIPLGGAVSEFGNMLDEYGDGDRGQKASA